MALPCLNTRLTSETSQLPIKTARDQRVGQLVEKMVGVQEPVPQRQKQKSSMYGIFAKYQPGPSCSEWITLPS